MRTSKKIVASVLAACMLASASVVTGFAATADESVGANTDYSRACEAIDKDYTYSGHDLGVLKLLWQLLKLSHNKPL